MKTTGNTILITGGSSGIGKGLAEAFHKLGNKVIISGRRKDVLIAVAQENPGMEWVELDVNDPQNINAVADKLISAFPDLNVLINNAGVMELDNVSGRLDDEMLVSNTTTNFFGPIRMTAAFVEHLKQKTSATIINVSSGMGFVPFAMGAVYSATKSAIHSYSLSLRYQLSKTSVKVVELVPPWVRTPLLNSQDAPQAMPFDEFISEVFALLETGADEILVERVVQLRNNPGENEHILVNNYNDAMLSGN